MISEGKALELEATGEWISDTSLGNAISQSVSEMIKHHPILRMTGSSIDGVSDLRIYYSSSLGGRHEFIMENFPQLNVGNGHSPVAAVRVGPHAVYKVKDTIKVALFDILTLIESISLTTTFFSIEAAKSAISFQRVLKKVAEGYIALTDSAEQEVFKAVVSLSSGFKVVDYDSFHRRELDRAVGHDYPEPKEIESYLSGRFNQETVSTAVHALIERGVLNEINGRLKIAF